MHRLHPQNSGVPAATPMAAPVAARTMLHELARELDPQEVAAIERAGSPELPPGTMSVPFPPAGARRSVSRGVPTIPLPPHGPAHLAPPPPARKGRGARSNPAGRFEAFITHAFDDGWETLAADFAALPPLATTTIRDASRTAIAWNRSPDVDFDRSVNPYRGCEHGCIYCYARPSHATLGFSPGLDFESHIVFKPEIAHLLERQLRRPGYTARPIALGANTDPYQPLERTLALTRAVLEVLRRFNHPVIITTKSAGVLRDIDILRDMAEHKLACVNISLTTLDPALARTMEPRAAAPHRRLQAIEQLAAAGVPVSVLAAPMIPGLNDAELERILAAAAKAGARGAGYILLRLPHELKALFTEWLEAHYPDRAAHVLSLIRETRAGALNETKFGQRHCGTGPYADLLARRFLQAARNNGLTERVGLDCTRFAVPAEADAERAQMSLF